MLRANLLLLGLLTLVPILVSGSKVRHLILTDSLKEFLGSLERYVNTENDVVLLLDESRSIDVEKFTQVKLFAKVISKRFTVSADHSRVAVVTFADTTDIHVNSIENPYGSNMCNLLVEIDQISYKALWTHTDLEGAMMQAERILTQSSRPGSNKIVVLLTNGESNSGHRAINVANRLKRDGIIIFAIGVANVNDAEIIAVATAVDHTCILDDFNYIKQINEYLVDDAREIMMDPARDSSYCDGICDERASCNCESRTGRYVCACQAGYQGKSGLKGHCHKCPRGSYKSEDINKDCTPCPPHTTTDKEGSRSILDCKCETGYEKIGNVCSQRTCPALRYPQNGKHNCSKNDFTFGTVCSFHCDEGYELLGSESRTCMINSWTGNEVTCEERTCPALRYPPNGKHNCSENDFTFGTVCSFYCDEGYVLLGSESRTCMINSWTGNEVTCEDIDECLDGSDDCEFICVDDVCTGSLRWECADDMVLSEDGRTCIDAGYCVKDGQTYMNEETWISDCQNCVCDKGIVKCTDIMCNETECQPGENECYIFSKEYHKTSVSRDSVEANSTAVLVSMCLFKLIIACIVSKFLL